MTETDSNEEFLKDAKANQEAAVVFADAILTYLDKHPTGSFTIVDSLTGSDGREVELQLEPANNAVHFQPTARARG